MIRGTFNRISIVEPYPQGIGAIESLPNISRQRRHHRTGLEIVTIHPGLLTHEVSNRYLPAVEQGHTGTPCQTEVFDRVASSLFECKVLGRDLVPPLGREFGRLFRKAHVVSSWVKIPVASGAPRGKNQTPGPWGRPTPTSPMYTNPRAPTTLYPLGWSLKRPRNCRFRCSFWCAMELTYSSVLSPGFVTPRFWRIPLGRRDGRNFWIWTCRSSGGKWAWLMNRTPRPTTCLVFSSFQWGSRIWIKRVPRVSRPSAPARLKSKTLFLPLL